MRFLLDTNICIHLMKMRNPLLLERMKTADIDHLLLSSITVAELQYGVAKSMFPDRNRAALLEFLLPFAVAPFAEIEAQHYGTIRAHLERAGKPIGGNDLLIAATALAGSMTLVTNNGREFARVPGLVVEDWTQ